MYERKSTTRKETKQVVDVIINSRHGSIPARFNSNL